jgi:hypothetical protein
MFESFYGLTRTPFSRDIPTDQLYQSHLLEETLGRLEYTAQRKYIKLRLYFPTASIFLAQSTSPFSQTLPLV